MAEEAKKVEKPIEQVEKEENENLEEDLGSEDSEDGDYKEGDEEELGSDEGSDDGSPGEGSEEGDEDGSGDEGSENEEECKFFEKYRMSVFKNFLIVKICASTEVTESEQIPKRKIDDEPEASEAKKSKTT